MWLCGDLSQILTVGIWLNYWRKNIWKWENSLKTIVSKEFVDLIIHHTQPQTVLQNFHSVVLTSPCLQQLLLWTCRFQVLYLSECTCLSRIQVASALWNLSFNVCKRSLIFSLSSCLNFFVWFGFFGKKKGITFKPSIHWCWNWKYLTFIFRRRELSFFFTNNRWFMGITEEPKLVFMNDWSPTNGHGVI